MKHPVSIDRGLSHVYRIDDDVMEDVRNFIFAHHHSADYGMQLSLSDFISKTNIPYRAKSKYYQYVLRKKSAR